jgi:hypothetical protein
MGQRVVYVNVLKPHKLQRRFDRRKQRRQKAEYIRLGVEDLELQLEDEFYEAYAGYDDSFFGSLDDYCGHHDSYWTSENSNPYANEEAEDDWYYYYDQ